MATSSPAWRSFSDSPFIAFIIMENKIANIGIVHSKRLLDIDQFS